MSHSSYIYNESQLCPPHLISLITEQSVIAAANEASKSLEDYLKYMADELKFCLTNQIKLYTIQKQAINFYCFRRC